MNGFFYGQTEFNMLNNAIHLDDYISLAIKCGYDFLTITDENMFAFLKFYNACQNANIKPVIGLKVRLDSTDLKDNYILLYAINDNGFQNLLKISSYQKIKGNLSMSVLSKYCADLFMVTAGEDSELNRLLADNMVESFEKSYYEFKNIFPSLCLGLDIQRHSNLEKNKILYEFAKATNIPLLPVHQTLYLEKEDACVYEALLAIGGRYEKVHPQNDFSFPLNISEEFKDFPLVFKNIDNLLRDINYSFSSQTLKLPEYPKKRGQTSEEFLKGLCRKGLEKRLIGVYSNKDIYIKRLEYELSVINKMGYNDYFLIVWDFVKYAKNNGILVGPGRGSAAGCLVAYSLGITSVDPIKYDLLFERFLNPERISMPDIDMDFPDDRRDEVINYVKETYGKSRVCNISAYGTFLVKSSIRDLGRIKRIPTARIETLISLASSTNDLEGLYASVNEEDGMFLQIAKKIENLPRHISTHAAGIIISKKPLFDIIPLQEGINGLYQSQLEASDLEKLGLLKIDFLGIRNLGIIDNIIKEIPLSQKELAGIPLDDYNTYQLFQRGDTVGVFQLESEGIKKVLKNLKPTCFEDIVAVLALYRPGPMDNIAEYILRKNGKRFNYLHPLLEPILKSTHGIIVYQEQIMKIATVFAGYGLGEADLLRRAVSKKEEIVLKNERTNFVKHSKLKGYDEKVANDIYDYIVKFANYGFNRSHSVAYALVSYQMAYLKANYFHIFMMKTLDNVIGSQSTMANYIRYAKLNGLTILPPCINNSTTKFKNSEKGIYFPLQGIFSVGEVVAKTIIEERKKGEFKSLLDFKERMNTINSRVLESLIHAGAFDIFGKTKKALISNSEESAMQFNKFLDDVKEINNEYDLETLRKNELTAIGINLKYDIFKDIKSLIYKYQCLVINQLKENTTSRLIVVFENIKEFTTKNNEKMASVTINDNNRTIEGVIFPKEFQQLAGILEKNCLFLITGNLYRNSKSKKISFSIINATKIY